MAMERQNSWGALVALDMFVGGAGAGVFALGFALSLTGEMAWLAFAGLVAGPVLVGAGMLLLLLEAGVPLRFYRLFNGLSSSWTSRGGLVQILFIILGLGYALPGLWLPQWPDSGARLAIGALALIASLVIAAYHGMVMGQARAIPLWSSSVLPVLSFFTALSTGLGLLLAISPVFVALYGAAEIESALGALSVTGAALIAGNLVTVWYLVSQHPSATYTDSIRAMRAAIITNVACLLLAFILLALGLTFGVAGYFLWLSLPAGVSLLAGGFVIRYAVLRGGYYAPMRVLL